MPIKLDSHHRRTMARLFSHPTSHNIQWNDVVALLERCGDVHLSHRGHWVVSVGGETITIGRPVHRDLDADAVIRVRHFLRDYVISSDATAALISLAG